MMKISTMTLIEDYFRYFGSGLSYGTNPLSASGNFKDGLLTEYLVWDSLLVLLVAAALTLIRWIFYHKSYNRFWEWLPTAVLTVLWGALGNGYLLAALVVLGIKCVRKKRRR